MEKVGVISDSYQPNADKPILYPIEIPKYTDVTVKLIWDFVLAVRRLRRNYVQNLAGR